MATRESVGPGPSWAGLASGPIAWALSSQVNYVLVPWQCANAANVVPWLASLFAATSLAGGYLSWRSWVNTRPGTARGLPRRRSTEHFIAGLAVLAALLFAMGILMQGLAGLVFDGCER